MALGALSSLYSRYLGVGGLHHSYHTDLERPRIVALMTLAMEEEARTVGGWCLCFFVDDIVFCWVRS